MRATTITIIQGSVYISIIIEVVGMVIGGGGCITAVLFDMVCRSDVGTRAWEGSGTGIIVAIAIAIAIAIINIINIITDVDAVDIIIGIHM